MLRNEQTTLQEAGASSLRITESDIDCIQPFFLSSYESLSLSLQRFILLNDQANIGEIFTRHCPDFGCTS